MPILTDPKILYRLMTATYSKLDNCQHDNTGSNNSITSILDLLYDKLSTKGTMTLWEIWRLLYDVFVITKKKSTKKSANEKLRLGVDINVSDATIYLIYAVM